MKKNAIIILLILSILTVQSTSTAFKFSDKELKASLRAPLRVCVLKDAKSLTLTIKGYYKIFTLKTNEPVKTGKNLRKAEVVPTASGLSVAGELFKIYGIKIVPKRDASIYIGRRSFRGSLDIIRTEENRLLVINHIDIEDYLKGVLYHEVSHWWPMETLKAQAIAARTYALYQKMVRRDKDYDLTNDIYSQVYGGRISEKFKTNRAVKLTRGRILTFKNKIFPTYYHATCGGRTEDASNLWNVNLVPLRGVKCNFCKHSPHYRWKYRISLSELEKKLKYAGHKVKNIKGVRLHGKTSSGRVKEVKVISNNRDLLISSNYFRLAVNPNHIRSTNFKLKSGGKNLSFSGYGWGHGVGMCQWGAFFLGMKRYRAERILRHYYPGTRVKKL